MRKFALAATAALALVLAACGGGTSSSSGSSSTPAAKTLNVFAAASLKDTFTKLGKTFESQNPGVTVSFNFAGSSDLATQIVNGAPADVFAAANTSTMDTVVKAGLVSGTPQVFVTNTLEIAVAPGNPKGITSFADLTKPGLKVVLCAPQVPCGSAELAVEKATGVDVKGVSEESDVTSVLSKVETGDADAGVVYVTDVKSAGDKVQGVPFPEAAQAVNKYPIAAMKNSKNLDLANSFIALVTGPDGKKVLQDAGFAPAA